ncbi:MAG TPA: hypothetical protein VGO62_18760, partial [Myxococcota bacterium]
SDQIEDRFGGQLELNLIADDSQSNDPRFAAGWRWRIGHRIDLEGTAGLGNAASAPAASTTTEAGADSARLRLLLFDHLPVGDQLAFEGSVLHAPDAGATTTGELRLAYRLFEGRPSASLFAFLFHDDAARSYHARPKPVGNAPVLTRVVAHTHGGAADTQVRDDARVRDSLVALFGRPIGDAPPYAIVGEALQRLRALKRYQAIKCVVQEPVSGGVLGCDVTKARVVRDVRIEGVPAAMLADELRHRIAIESGDAIDALDNDVADKAEDGAVPKKLARQEKSVLDYLEREGFHGATVRVQVEPHADVADPSLVDLVCTVSGGRYVHVRRVDVVVRGDHGALDGVDTEDIANRFRALCLRPDSLVDGAFSGSIACYSRQRVRDRCEDIERELRTAGYPEARVRVTATFDGPKADLRVRVRRGPKLTSHIVVDRKSARRATGYVDVPNVFTDQLLWLRHDIYEPAGRLVGASPDDDVIIDDLQRQLTFDNARATDEAEAQVSARALEDVLKKRGHPDVSVAVKHEYDERGDVDVHFLVRP